MATDVQRAYEYTAALTGGIREAHEFLSKVRNKLHTHDWLKMVATERRDGVLLGNHHGFIRECFEKVMGMEE